MLRTGALKSTMAPLTWFSFSSFGVCLELHQPLVRFSPNPKHANASLLVQRLPVPLECVALPLVLQKFFTDEKKNPQSDLETIDTDTFTSLHRSFSLWVWCAGRFIH